jgi:VWFA-related protein
VFFNLRVRFYMVIFAATCYVVVATHSQEKSQPAKKFAVHTELVLIPTVVIDKEGSHVTGLRREDFAIFQDGDEQKLGSFEEITTAARGLPPSDKSNVFSNSFLANYPVPRFTVIVLDLINTTISDQTNARDELVKYLSKSLDPDEPTGLYALTRSGIEVVCDFTSDPRILISALHQINGEPGLVDTVEGVGGYVESNNGISAAGSTSSSTNSTSRVSSGGNSSGRNSVPTQAVRTVADRLQTMLQQTNSNLRDFEQRFAITYTLEAMQTMAHAMIGLPGRKSLIWVTAGFPFTVSGSMALAPAGRDTLADLLPMYEQTWKLLNDAEISLYPVDARGLEVPMLQAASSGTPDFRSGKNKLSRRAVTRQLDRESAFRAFAAATGGRAYYNSNDLAKGFRDAANDSSEYYILGYYFDRSRATRGWHKLAVKVNRSHVDVRARNGFFVTDTSVDSDHSRVTDLSTALASPLNYTSISMEVQWNEMEAEKRSNIDRVAYQVRVHADSGMVDQMDDNRMALEVVALPLTPEGKQVGQPQGQKVDIHLSSENLSIILKKGISFKGAFDLAPGQYTVRFVVRDNLTGRTGSVSAPVKVQ